MALIVEDGTGVAGAESYAAIAFIDSYWAARPNSPFSVSWAAVTNTTPKKEGAAREATAFLDANFGFDYRGTRKNYTQGLEWPRNGDADVDDEDDDGDITEFLPVRDANGIDFPALPIFLQQAVAELAARSAVAPLVVDDVGTEGKVKRKKLDGVGEKEFFEPGVDAGSPRYGFVLTILGPILKSGGAAIDATWYWA